VSDDFQVISKRHVPPWREVKKVRRPIAEAVMVPTSLASLVLVWTPWRHIDEIRTAISIQLAQGDAVAMAIFAFMGLVLLVMGIKLWRARRFASAILMAAEVGALAALAATNPTSDEHLLMFGALALASSAWLVVLAYDLEDPWLGVAAAAGILSLALIPWSIGLGERALITSCLAGMNLMVFRHFVD
jgi:hypothetical protein